MMGFACSALTLCLGLIPLRAESVLPTLSLTSSETAEQGSYLTLSLQTPALSKISAFSCLVSYPTESLDLSSQYVDSSLTIYNCKETTKGQITFSFLSGDKDGVTFSEGTSLLTLSFYVHQDAALSRVRFDCAVGEVYDVDKNPVSIKSSYCYTDILKRQETTSETVSISLSSPSLEAHQGDDVQIVISSSYWANLTTSRLIVTFDYSYFDFVSFTYSDSLEASQNNTNTKQQGVVSWAMTSMSGVSFYGEVATLTLKVKNDQNATSTIHGSLSQVRNTDSKALNGSSASYDIKIVQSLPQMRMTNLTILDEVMTLDCVIDGKSKMACGDFTITYPVDSLKLEEASTNIPNKVILSRNKDDGKLNFSYLDSSDIQEDVTLLSLKFQKRNYLETLTGNIGISLRYTDELPRNSKHEKLEFTYLSSSYSWPFELKNITFEESWASIETFNSGDDVYFNSGDSIKNVKVNGHLIESFSLISDDIEIKDATLIASKPCVISFGVDSGSFFIKDTIDTSRAYPRRATEYALKLDTMTTDQRICDSNGFISEKKEALLSLLKEYRSFPEELRSLTDSISLTDGTTVSERLRILERGESKTKGENVSTLLSLQNSLSSERGNGVIASFISIAVVIVSFLLFFRRKLQKK